MNNIINQISMYVIIILLLTNQRYVVYTIKYNKNKNYIKIKKTMDNKQKNIAIYNLY